MPRVRATPRVSVVVPVRDDLEGIRALLACLSAQTLPSDRFEVVIGDDGSRADQVPRVATADGRVRVVEGSPRTSYAARNAAVAISSGSVLAFCDSDCRPQPDWLEEALAALGQADVVAGEVTFVPPARPSLWSLLTIDMFLDQQRNVCFARGVTANLSLRRELFAELEGFDESLSSGGDYDLVRRAVARGARLRYAPRAVVRHPTMNRSGEFLRKVWRTNRCSGARRARDGDPLDPLGALTFVPVFGAMMARRHALRPLLRLHRPRLRAAAVAPAWRQELGAVLLIYSVICYVAGAGRVLGWLDGLTGRVAAPAYRPLGRPACS